MILRNYDLGAGSPEAYERRRVGHFPFIRAAPTLRQCIHGVPLQGIAAERQIRAADSASNVCWPADRKRAEAERWPAVGDAWRQVRSGDATGSDRLPTEAAASATSFGVLSRPTDPEA